MNLNQFMASQLRQPSGWFGSLVMSRMLNLVNDKIGRDTIALLEIRPEHHVLEIGFGGGSALAWLLKQAETGKITGVEISAEMLQQSERRFRRDIAAGRLRLQLGDVARLPFDAAAFDRVFTINTIYFWPDVLQGLAEIYRVLKPGGRAAISIRSKEKLQDHQVSKHFARLVTAEDVVHSMSQVGFRDVGVDHRDRDKLYDQVIVIGSR